MIESETRIIPRTMSTQHPDNVTLPEWTQGPLIDGNAEVYEAFYSYSTLGCQEAMWDSEGKDVDTRVVRKLLSTYWDYFQGHVLGEDLRLTYRIPNPTAESVEKKVVVETLLNIPVSSDVAAKAYGRSVAPIFEVILPFTTSGNEPIWLYNYYRKAIVANEELLLDNKTKAKDWIGTSSPKRIEVIPLVEDFNSISNVDTIVQPYINVVKPKHLRVFLARSDPALNYGLICAVLLQKIALSKLKITAKKNGISIHPIVGVGTKPFRGHLSPDNVDKFLQEYRGLATVTVQSAARYDYSLETTKRFVETLNSKLPNGEAQTVCEDEEDALLSAMRKCMNHYGEVVEALAPLVNSLSSFVPQRRARKLHIGLFGYSRKMGTVSLPRAIPFAASLYSVGIPPEFIGCKALEELTEQEWEAVENHYVNLTHDLISVGGYVSLENINMLLESHEKAAAKANMSVEKLEQALTKILEDFKAVEEKLVVKLGPRTPSQKRHCNFTNNFLISYLERNNAEEAKRDLIEAAKLRKCLG